MAFHLIELDIVRTSPPTIEVYKSKPYSSCRIEGGRRLRGSLNLASKSGIPLVSIITVVYNGERYLEKTIQSAINQTYGNIEYIIIDAGSTDNTLNIIRKYEDSIDYWLSEPDEGISDAFNKGIALSSGDIIGIINADDWYELDTVRQVVEHIAKSGADIVHGMLQYWNDQHKAELFEAKDSLLNKDMTVNHTTVFVSRMCYQRYGLFRKDFRYAMDYEWLLRAKVNGAIFSYIERCLANMRLGGLSDSRWQSALYEVAKAKSINLHGIINCYFYFVYQIIKGGIRRLLEWAGLNLIARLYHSRFSLVKKIHETESKNKID